MMTNRMFKNKNYFIFPLILWAFVISESYGAPEEHSGSVTTSAPVRAIDVPQSVELPSEDGVINTQPKPIGLCAHELNVLVGCICGGPIGGVGLCRQIFQDPEAGMGGRLFASFCCPLISICEAKIIPCASYWLVTGPCTGQQARQDLKSSICCEMGSGMPGEVMDSTCVYGHECQGELWKCFYC